MSQLFFYIIKRDEKSDLVILVILKLFKTLFKLSNFKTVIDFCLQKPTLLIVS